MSNIPVFLDTAHEIFLGGKKWLLLKDRYLTGQENMDRDRKLLQWAYKNQNSIPVLRFFLWKPPAISIGFGQSIKEIDIEKCLAMGIDVVKRPTGGKAIFHHTEFTYSITTPPYHILSQMSILETYNEISRALALGLKNLGLNAKLSKGDPTISTKNPSCFSSTSRYELVVDEKKIVGSAQRRKNGAVLQQGSILAGPQYLRLSDFILTHREIVKDELENHSTYIEKCLGYIPDYEDFISAMVSGFKSAWEDTFL